MKNPLGLHLEEKRRKTKYVKLDEELKTTEQNNHYVLFKDSCLDPRMDYIRPKSDTVKVFIAL